MSLVQTRIAPQPANTTRITAQGGLALRLAHGGADALRVGPGAVVGRTGDPGEKGDKGDRGDPGEGQLIVLTAASAVGGHRAVTQTPTGVVHASAADAAHAGRVVGISTHAAAPGATVLVRTAGPLAVPGANWTPNSDLWLSADGLIATAPPVGAAFVQALGFADSAASIWINPSEPVSTQ